MKTSKSPPESTPAGMRTTAMQKARAPGFLNGLQSVIAEDLRRGMISDPGSSGLRHDGNIWTPRRPTDDEQNATAFQAERRDLYAASRARVGGSRADADKG